MKAASVAFCADFQFTSHESLGLRSASCWFDSLCETRLEVLEGM